MNKVILTKEQAEALELLKSTNYCFGSVISILHIGGFNLDKHFSSLNTLNSEKLANSWINGYVVEKSGEEKVLEKYKEMQSGFECKSGTYDPHVYKYAMDRVKEVLNNLDIKIEGINC